MTFSVRFFKRLILLVLLMMIVVPTVLSVMFGLEVVRLRDELLEQGIEPPPGQSQESPNPSGDPLVVPTSYDTTLEAETLPYQALFPELYGTAVIPAQRIKEIDTVYLTFDCTPSSNTIEILNQLDVYGIKATFFVSSSTDPNAQEIMREIADRGHSIGIGLRGDSSSYQKLYQSVEDFLTDFKEIYDLVYETTGIRAEIFRFPGGSVNSYNSGIYQELIAEMLRRNFVFFDWNITEGSADGGELTAEKIITNVINHMAGKDRAIIKFKDSAGREMVAGALPSIIEQLQAVGYSFQPLTAAVLPMAFMYP